MNVVHCLFGFKLRKTDDTNGARVRVRLRLKLIQSPEYMPESNYINNCEMQIRGSVVVK